MTRTALSALLLSGAALLAACATPGADPAPQTAEEALAAYYATLPDVALPQAGPGPELEETELVTRILVGSCFDEERPAGDPVLASMVDEEADLALWLGDNVYGDRDGRRYINNQPDLEEVRESFAQLAARDDFQRLRRTVPIMATWDDHDYGANDAGREFPFRQLAERVHETFWGLGSTEASDHSGVYYSQTAGPEGRRVQIIMLDTRYFRSPLTLTDDWGAPGKERYLPSAAAAADQEMLGEQQWEWLENTLREPADLRILASSIQILPTTGHGWESWSRLPAERDRLLAMLEETGAAPDTVLVSGDRHTAFLYETPGGLSELTASSMNLSFAETSDETDPLQQGAGYAPVNYGVLDIDWESGTVAMRIADAEGHTVRTQTARFR